MNVSVNKSLNDALRWLLETDDKVICLGEDIHDPYGGAFKVTQGLSTQFPERVITTPVSEAGIVGVGIGLSMMGYKPIVEIMFGDFILLAADQIINHLSKFHILDPKFGPRNIVIRTPMGGGRGYGPTHSQSLERHFMGVSGINVIAVSLFADAGELLINAIQLAEPVIFIENKLLYGQPNGFHEINDDARIIDADSLFPTYVYTPTSRSRPDFSVISYGWMSKVCYEAINELYEKEKVVGELFVPTHLSNIDFGYLRESVRDSGFLVIVEEHNPHMGFGSLVTSTLHNQVSFKALGIGARDRSIIPNARHLESQVLPTKDSVYTQITEFLHEWL